MSRKFPKTIPGTSYHKFHPAVVKSSSISKEWNELYFVHYIHPKHFRGSPRPATSDHILAFGSEGAVKGENAINSDHWKPYKWYEEEWFIGPAYGNDRDSCWDTLCDESQDLGVCYIHLSPAVLKRAAVEFGQFDADNLELPIKMGLKDPFMYQIGLQIKHEVEAENPFGSLYVESLTNILALHLLKFYCKKPIRTYSQNNSCPRKYHAFRRVVEYIREHLNDDLSIRTLSELANMSEFYFAHRFRESMGVAPHQYVMEEKNKKARSLLRNTVLPIELIAADLGCSGSYFVQVFKRQNGITPSNYRKQTK